MKTLIFVIFMLASEQGLTSRSGPSVVTNNAQEISNVVIEQTTSQASHMYDHATLYIPGSEADSSTKLAGQYNCSMITDINFKVLGKTVNITFTVLTDFVEVGTYCYVGLGDGFAISGYLPSPYVFVKYTYNSTGTYRPTLYCRTVHGRQEHCPHPVQRCTEQQSMFDPVFKHTSNPLRVYTTDVLELKAIISLTNNCSQGQASYNWKIYHLDHYHNEPFQNFTQPNGIVLKLPPETLEPGLYVIVIEVLVFGASTDTTLDEDFMYVSIVLPELIATLSGASVQTFPKGSTFIADGTKSRDPVTSLPSLTSFELSVKWNLFCMDIEVDKLYEYFSEFDERDLTDFTSMSSNVTSYEVLNGSTLQLTFDTSLVTHDICIIVLKAEKGSRSATAMQGLILVASEPWFISMKCVSNCNHGRHNKVNFGKLQLDTDITWLDVQTAQHADNSSAWTISEVTSSGLIDVSNSIGSETGLFGGSLSLTGTGLQQGKTYVFTVTMATMNASFVRTVNHLPYGGNCTLDKTTGIATLDVFLVTCKNWRDDGERRKKSSDGRTDTDTNPILTYTVVQTTPGAAVRVESMAISRLPTFQFVAKLGNPDTEYSSTIEVLVADHAKDAFKSQHDIQVTGSFVPSDVTKTEAGSQVVTAFMNTVLPKVEYLDEVKDYRMKVAVAVSAASQMHQISIVPGEPPIPTTLEGQDGVILDLSVNFNPDDSGDTTEIDFTNVFSESLNSTIDPTTQIIQEAFGNLTEVVADAVPRIIDVTSDSPRDQKTTAWFVSAFTNMVAMGHFASNFTKAVVVSQTSVLGESILDESEDPDKKDTANGLVVLSGSTVDAVVPDGLNEARGIVTMEMARHQIDDMVSIEGGNLSAAIDHSKMSPDERAFLYLKIQRHIRYRLDIEKPLAEDSAKSALQVARDIHNNTELCSTCSTVIGGDNSQQLLIRRTARDLGNTLLNTSKTSVKLDSISEQGEESVSAAVTYFGKNLFMYDGDGRSSEITSGVTHVDLKSSSAYVSLGYVTYEQSIDVGEPQLVHPIVLEEDASKFSLHKFVYRSKEDDVCLRINPVSNHIRQYDVYVRREAFPTILEYDVLTTVGPVKSWIACVGADAMAGHTGITYLGIQAVFKDESNTTEVHRTKRQTTDNSTGQDTGYPPYYFTVFTVACTVWEEEEKKWNSKKCELEYLPDDSKIRCHCRDIKDLVFGNSFFKAPNSIDFSTVFLRFSPLSQAAVLATLSLIFVIYVIVLLWARRQDRKDLLKWGITPLIDNFKEDEYFYLIKVYTGLRPWSGTRSRALFVVSGDQKDTGVRELYDGVRQEFATGSVTEFLMATSSRLGQLQYVRLWHDNSGKGNHASWYLSKIVVQDIQENEGFTFLCEKWLAVENQEIGVDCVIPVSGKENLRTFTNLFLLHAKKRLSDGHMWVSLVYRPCTSSFTRTQRATCVLLYVVLSMVANAMYFDPEDEYETPAVVQAGPFRFSLEQLYVSIVSALITTPAVMVIIFLFRRSKRRISTEVSVVNTDTEIINEHSPLLNRKLIKIAAIRRWLEKEAQHEGQVKSKLMAPGIPHYEGFYLPWVFQGVAWFLAVGGIVTCSVFILLYSVEWGKQKSEEWLSSFFLSLVESVTLIDTILVILTAAFLALMCRSIKGQRSQLDASSIKEKQYASENSSGRRRQPPPPLSDDTLEIARQARLHEIQMRRVLKDVVINMFSLWILFSISYSNRDDRSYHLHQHLVNTLQTPRVSPRFDRIKTPSDLYNWMNYTVVPTLFPEVDMNGRELHWRFKDYMTGFNNYKLGPPRMRQIRVKTEPCKVISFNTQLCEPGFNNENEDTDNYCISWNQRPCLPEEPVYNFTSPAWKYTSAFDIWGLPVPGHIATYSGGGYIATLDVSRNVSIQILNELFSSMWIDGQTRAVTLEFTLYSVSVNLFVNCLFLVEFPEIGGAFTSFSILPLRVYHHIGAVGRYVLACEIIYLVQMVIFLVLIGIGVYEKRRKYFKQFWSWFEIIRFLFSGLAIGLYFVRRSVALETIEKFNNDKKLFVEFRHIAIIDQTFVALLGLLAFMATLRILKILGTNKNVRAVVRIFSNSAPEIFWLGCLMIYIFVGFAFLGFLFFGSKLLSYKDMYKTVGTLFITIIGKSKFTEINETEPVLAKIFFLCFVFTVVLLMLTIFMATLSSSIDTVVQDTRKDESEELIGYLLRKMKLLFNIGESKNAESCDDTGTCLEPMLVTEIEEAFRPEDDTCTEQTPLDTNV